MHEIRALCSHPVATKASSSCTADAFLFGAKRSFGSVSRIGTGILDVWHELARLGVTTFTASMQMRQHQGPALFAADKLVQVCEVFGVGTYVVVTGTP